MSMNRQQRYTYTITLTDTDIIGSTVGFVTNKKIWQYDTFTTVKPFTPGTNIPTSTAISTMLSASNFRWNQILKNIGFNAMPILIGNVVTSSMTIDTCPSTITFDVVYENVDYITYPDSFNDGVVLTGVDAIKRMVSLVLANQYSQQLCEVFNATLDDLNRPYGVSTIKIDILPIVTGSTLEARVTALETNNITVTVVKEEII